MMQSAANKNYLIICLLDRSKISMPRMKSFIKRLKLFPNRLKSYAAIYYDDKWHLDRKLIDIGNYEYIDANEFAVGLTRGMK